MNASRIVATLSLLFALALSPASGEASAEGIPVVKYPPYPDVWGRELPLLPGSDGRLTLTDPHIDKNGRVLIGYTDWEGIGARRSISRLYDIFAGKVVGRWIKSEPSNPPGYADKFDYLEKHGFGALKEVTRSGLDKPVLPDGGWLETSTNGWYQFLNYGLRKTDAAGRQIFNWMIVHVDDSLRKITGFTGGEFYSSDKDDMVRTTALFPIVFSLPDGTFLVKGVNQRLILRYRGDLDSPYIARSGKVLLMNPERVREMHRQAARAAEKRLIQVRERHPDFPWLLPELADMLFTQRIKLLIDQKRKRK